MVILRGLVLGVILAAANAQQRAQQFECRDLEDNLERFTGKETRVVPDLCRMMGRVFEGGVRTRVVPNSDTNLVLVGTAEQVAAMTAVLAQLRRPDLQELRVQCTLVTMPLEAATAAGLVAGKVLEVDEGKAGKVLKDAVAAKGTFRNLPEAGGLPLQPFVIGKAKEARPGTAAAALAGSCVRVEALPLSADEAWFSLQWTGELPSDRVGPVPQAQFEAAMRLKAGGGAMVMSAQGQQAVVMWFRFAYSKDAPLHQDAAARGKGGEPARPGK